VGLGGIDRVIAYSTDRLSRKMGVVAFLADELVDVGAELVFATERYTNDSTGRLLQAFQEWKGEAEREAILERTTRGKRAKARAGALLPGCRPRYGYRFADAKRTRFEIDPETGAVVRQVFTWAADGMSLREISQRLTQSRVPTPTGRGVTWVHTVVRNILLDEQYIGRAVAFRRVGQMTRSKTGIRYRRSSERLSENQIPLPEGTIPPLVDQDTFAVVADRLAKNKVEARRQNKNPEASLLRAGFIKCGYCDGFLTVSNRHGEYRCARNRTQPNLCSGVPRIGTMLADTEAWKRVRTTLLDRTIIEREVERRAADDGAAERDVARIDELLAELDRKRRNLTANLADLDPDSAGEVRAMLRTLSERRSALEKERAEAQTRHERRREDLGRLRGIQEWQARVARNLDDLDYTGKRNALLAVGLTMTVWRQEHTPRWEIKLDIDPSTIVDSMSLQVDPIDQAQPLQHLGDSGCQLNGGGGQGRIGPGVRRRVFRGDHQVAPLLWREVRVRRGGHGEPRILPERPGLGHKRLILGWERDSRPHPPTPSPSQGGGGAG
jgi:site-specific DNA recombinase